MSQKDEIATIAPRTFKLELSDEDVKRIFEKAAGVGLTPEQLLENFIGDLVCGTYSNGSDERMYADMWFERCGFSFLPDKTLLRFLIDRYDVEDFVDSYEEMKYYEKSPEEFDEKPEWAYDDYSEIIKEYTEWCSKGGNSPDVEAEIANVMKWHEHYNEIRRKDDYVKASIIRNRIGTLCENFSIPYGTGRGFGEALAWVTSDKYEEKLSEIMKQEDCK